MRGAPPPGAILCRIDDLADPGSRGFMFREGDDLFQGFVVRRGSRVFGYIDRCPHAGFPLALDPDRYLTRDGALILCASHGALFRAADGVCVAGPCAGRALRPWPVKVSGSDVVCA